ncbi:PDZ and LIM domain protein Zasp-like isoform X2 [Lineus longissimus]|uniref:PDZ and LIM domain protein Zasp-like isoform X2 n=1 Tax=Lineus longissimus TaxID=88925 RepID=UPI00315CB994
MSEGIQISAKLERTTTESGQQTPWGFRLQGGKDFSRPLTILRVTPGSLADKCGLKGGDMIMKIGENDVSNAFHKDAQAFVMKSGDCLELSIQRGGRAPMPMMGGGDYPMYNEDNSGYLNPNPQYGTPTGPGPREYAAQNVTQQMSNLNLNPMPAPYSPHGQQSAGYTGPQSPSFLHLQNELEFDYEGGDEIDASNNNVSVAPPKDNDTPPELPSNPPPDLPACPPPDFQLNQPQRVVKKQYNSPAGLYAGQTAGEVKAESYTHSIIKAAARPAGISEPSPSIPDAPAFEPKKSETYRLLKKEEVPKNNSDVQNGSNSLSRKSKPKPLVNDDPDREPMHSRSFKMLQQQLQSDTYGKEPLPPAMALRQGSPNPDIRGSPLPARVSPNPATDRKFSPVPFRPASPRSSSPQMQSVSPQMAPERKMTPPSIAVTPEVNKPEVKTAPAPYVKQYNSPAGLYSVENTAAAEAPPADATVHIMVERPVDEPLPDFADDGSKLYRPQFSDTWKLLQEKEAKKDKEKAEDKTVPSERPAEPNLGRTMNSLRQQLTTEHRDPGPSHNAPAMRPSQPAPAPAWQPRHVPPAPVAVPNAQVSGHKWQPPSARPTAPQQGQYGAPSSGRGGTRGRKGDASMRQGDSTRIPVCSQCGSPVRGPFVLALGKSWCPNHFCCANCNCKLIDIGFIEEGGKLYCEKDYEQFFAPHCKKCNQAIIGDCVHAMNSEYHPHCFVCTHCRQPIGNSGFHMEDGQPFCERDWMQMFQTKCAACDFPVEPGDHWVEAMGANYHADCFCCAWKDHAIDVPDGVIKSYTS